jgi:hypothetical protein
VEAELGSAERAAERGRGEPSSEVSDAGTRYITVREEDNKYLAFMVNITLFPRTHDG